MPGAAFAKPKARKRVDRWEECISPIDYRYWHEEAAEYLSVAAYIDHLADYELAVVHAYHRASLCPQAVVEETERSIAMITTEQVYAAEELRRHDIQGLIDTINAGVSDETKGWIHLGLTSYDVISTAEAKRYHDFMNHVFLPACRRLVEVVALFVKREAETPQVGRTHGKHAVPMTFGFGLSWHLSRIAQSVVRLEGLTYELIGKVSGAVGARNALSTICSDPQQFEEMILEDLGLRAGETATQIVQPEPLTRLLQEMSLLMGALGNLADDMRHLSREEIAEICLPFESGQAGSSAMPQKVNPIDFEQVCGIWSIIIGRIVTVMINLISEHQRDLRNSLPMRTIPEIFAYIYHAVLTMERAMGRVTVDREQCLRNLHLKGDKVLAEHLKMILLRQGYVDAYVKSQALSKRAESEGVSLFSLAQNDPDVAPLLEKADPQHLQIMREPILYSGTAAEDAHRVADRWLEWAA